MCEKNLNYENYWKIIDYDYLNSKNKVLKLLKILGVDARYISYSPNTIYINNVRFSKFSKKREKIFKKYFPEIAIIRSTIFQKICNRASKILADELDPKDNILLLKPQQKIDDLLKIVFEPYSRKYGINIFESDFLSTEEYNLITDNMSKNGKKKFNAIASSVTLNKQVRSVLSSIFSGKGINKYKLENNKTKIIYPFINVPNDWIDSFFASLPHHLQKDNYNKDLKNEDYNKILKKDNYNKDLKNEDYNKFFKNDNYNKDLKNEDYNKFLKNKNYNKNNNYLLNKEKNESDKIAISFMRFLDDIVPQYKENIIKSTIFIKKNSSKKIY